MLLFFGNPAGSVYEPRGFAPPPCDRFAVSETRSQEVLLL